MFVCICVWDGGGGDFCGGVHVYFCGACVCMCMHLCGECACVFMSVGCVCVSVVCVCVFL